VAGAQRLYLKVTNLAPRFVYGWSNLGNTQGTFMETCKIAKESKAKARPHICGWSLVALGALGSAEASYDNAVTLCRENLRTVQASDQGLVAKRCDDIYLLLLNRGCLRLNQGRHKVKEKNIRKNLVLFSERIPNGTSCLKHTLIIS